MKYAKANVSQYVITLDSVASQNVNNNFIAVVRKMHAITASSRYQFISWQVYLLCWVTCKVCTANDIQLIVGLPLASLYSLQPGCRTGLGEEGDQAALFPQQASKNVCFVSWSKHSTVLARSTFVWNRGIYWKVSCLRTSGRIQVQWNTVVVRSQVHTADQRAILRTDQ